jgi:hypothetical protein
MQTAQYTQMIRFRAPPGLPEALAQAAKARNMRAADYMRQALLAILTLDGIRLCNGQVEQAKRAAA